MNSPAGSGRGDWHPPALELPGSIGWRLRYTKIIFADPPYLVLQATPVFPRCHERLADQGVVWDPLALAESIVRPGAHYLLTCDCGYAPDAGIEQAVLVSHPRRTDRRLGTGHQGVASGPGRCLSAEPGLFAPTCPLRLSRGVVGEWAASVP